MLPIGSVSCVRSFLRDQWWRTPIKVKTYKENMKMRLSFLIHSCILIWSNYLIMFLSQTSQMCSIRAVWVCRCSSAEEKFLKRRSSWTPKKLWVHFHLVLAQVRFLRLSHFSPPQSCHYTIFSVYLVTTHCHLLQHNLKKCTRSYKPGCTISVICFR